MPTLLPEQTITPAGQPKLLLLPSGDIFTRRKERFNKLSQHHSLAPWLHYLATVSEAQQTALETLSTEPFDWVDVTQPVQLPVTEAMLAKVAAVYAVLLVKVAGEASTGVDASATAHAQALPQDELRSAVERCLLLSQAQIDATGRDVTDVLVAAAMQVVWTALARQMTPSHLQAANSEYCPVCASVAVGSMVLAGEGRGGLRYQQCCLCSSRWNVVRAHCTLCDEGSTVHYLSLEGENAAIGAETCEHCHGYAKIFFQDKDPDVDPVADDLATLALDVLVGEEGFGRATPSLFLCEGEAS